MIRVAFLTCHLTGSGHLVRTLALARAVTVAGGAAVVLSGGRPLAHLDTDGVAVVQIPPVHVDGFDYGVLRQPDGAPADDAWTASRGAAIRSALAAFRPDAFVTETYPLGRRTLATEFETAIRDARAAGARRVAASVRDIPEPKPKRIAEAAERITRLFDAVLVHGDPDLVPLSATWPLPAPAASRVRYTGYVADAAATPDLPRGPDILVAVGGGVLGRSLLETAAAAGAASDRPWHLLVGGPDGAGIAAALTARHGRPGMTIEAARRDYRTLLAGAACSVSLAGYNTALDLAGCRTPALLAPWTSGGEREQAIRAAALAGFPGFALLPEDIGPEALRRRAEAAALGPRRDRLTIGRNGAARSAAILNALLRDQGAEPSGSLDASNPSDDGSNS